MVNVQAGRIREAGIVIRADPAPGLGLAGVVDLDSLAISLQHIFTVFFFSQSLCQPLPSLASYKHLRKPWTYRALQFPEMASQVGNKSREYPVPEPATATVRPASWVLALSSEGIPGYHVSEFSLSDA